MNFIERTIGKAFALLKKTAPVISSKIIYFKTFRKRLDLKNPTSFNEKLMWLKLNEDDALKTLCTDKYAVREYVAKLGYSKILNEIYHVYNRVEDIDFNQLPRSFAMKCTHGCGFNIICSNVDRLDKKKAIMQLKKWMKTDYSLVNGEPHYSKIQPRIIVEKYLEEKTNKSTPLDFKIHCFHGEPHIIEVALASKDIMFNHDWTILPYNEASMHFEEKIEKPEKLDEMLEIAKVLSSSFTYVRVDLYYCNNEIYFGELTFTPAACLDIDFINDADYQMGRLLDLTDLRNKSPFKLSRPRYGIQVK